MRHLFALHVKRPEALDARYVDECAAARQFIQFAERRGVHTRAVRLGYFCRAGVCLRHEVVEQRGFAHARVAGEECRLALQRFAKFVQSLARNGRDDVAGIAYFRIKCHPIVACGAFVLTLQFVIFIECQHHRHAIGFC